MPELETLDFFEDWQSLDRGQTLQQIEQNILPAYLPKQRWFASKGTKIKRAELASRFILSGPGGQWLLSTFRVHLADGHSEDYFVPLAIDWRQPPNGQPSGSSEILASVRKDNQAGVLKEALGEPRFIADVIRALGDGRELTSPDGSLRFTHTNACFTQRDPEDQAIKRLGAEQSNSSIVIARKMILKVYRKLESGIQPEMEIGRFLTDVANFKNTPPLLGAVEQFGANGQPTALAAIHGYIPNDGDGWSFTLAHLKQFFKRILAGNKDATGIQSYSSLMERLGNRIGELQRAFALESDDPAFRPEPISAEDIERRKEEIRCEAETTLGLLAGSEMLLPPEQQARVRALLDRRRHILDLISGFELDSGSNLMKTRFHGDLHLGQVLVAGDDFYIIDFEGEPARPFTQRRAKQSPLKDLAGMLRSLDYAAWSALFESGAGESGKMARLENEAIQWARESSEALIRGHRKTAEGCCSFPADPGTFRRLLEIFILEKALYEIRYELANRPSWLSIPVEGIMSLLQTQ